VCVALSHRDMRPVACPRLCARRRHRRWPGPNGRSALEVSVLRDAIRTREFNPAAPTSHRRDQAVEVCAGEARRSRGM